MNIVVLEADALGKDVDLSCLNAYGEVTIYPASTIEDTPEKVKNAEVIVVNRVLMNEQTLKDAENLKMIAITATGYNMIDKAYTDSRGITVANVKGYSTDSVAQHTFALVLFLMEQMGYYDEFVKSGTYASVGSFDTSVRKTYELAGKTWGIIGMGAIGRKVAEIASVFGCKVIYYSTSGNNKDQGYPHVELDELLKKSDIVSVHAPLNQDTQGLLTLEKFRLMKPSALFINMARGLIVKEEDLAQALKEGAIAAAGLDVLCKEPMEVDNPLLQFQDSGKLVITPHIAWATVEARQRVVEEVGLNIQAFLKGEERNLIP